MNMLVKKFKLTKKYEGMVSAFKKCNETFNIKEFLFNG